MNAYPVPVAGRSILSIASPEPRIYSSVLLLFILDLLFASCFIIFSLFIIDRRLRHCVLRIDSVISITTNTFEETYKMADSSIKDVRIVIVGAGMSSLHLIFVELIVN